MAAKDGDVDYYAALGLEAGAPAAAVSKAYKKLALKHHPDRNPGDPLAAQRFHAIQQAYDVLSDPEARAAFDQLLQARLHRKRKVDAMDAHRRAKRQDLEERENAYKRQRADELDAQRRLAARMARLKEEAAARIQQEQQRRQEKQHQMAKNVHSSASRSHADGDGGADDVVVKLKWGRKEGWDDEEGVRKALERAGCPAPRAVAVRRRGGGALLTYGSLANAEAAIARLPAPITGRIRSRSTSTPSTSHTPAPSSSSSTPAPTTPPTAMPTAPTSAAAGMSHADFESQVLARMLQAAAAMRQAQAAQPAAPQPDGQQGS